MSADIVDKAAFTRTIVDRLSFPPDPRDAVNTALVTTGLVPLVSGSTEKFALAPTLDGVPWNMGGGAVSLTVKDPSGNTTTISGSISADGFSATAPWTVSSTVGTWTRSWTVNVSGVIQTSQPVTFTVTSSP